MVNSKIAVDKEAEFFQVSRDGAIVYYPASAHAEVRATYPGASRMRGYAVYDTSVSSKFAIELFQSAAAARKFVGDNADRDLSEREHREVPDELRTTEIDSSNLEPEPPKPEKKRNKKTADYFKKSRL